MLFGHHTLDRTVEEHLSDIATLASDPQTLVFIDTNILAYLYKLHDAARQEFFAWTDGLVSANRLAVPAWAANEYLARVTSKALDSYTPKGKEVTQVERSLEALFEAASLFVDNSSLRRIAFVGDRASFLTGFRGTIDRLKTFTNVFSQQFEPGVVHQQVVQHLSGAILDADLSELCMRASHEGNGRFEHRLPPGFRDSEKNENRYGDLIIWYEILGKAYASVADFPKVLFVTNDEKSDWVYAPRMRVELVRGARKAIGNSWPEIKVADPRLIAEFRGKVGHSDFAICSLATLIEGLSRVGATLFSELAAAIQINMPEPASAAAVVTPEVVSPEDDVVSAPATEEPPPQVEQEVPPNPVVAEEEALAPPRLTYAATALRDAQYQADAPSEINSVIRALKSLNWYTQNPAVVAIRSIRQEDFTPSAWFVLGRNIYQAACGNAQKAMEFMASLETQLSNFPDETAQHLLAGILFETYFDSHGEFRSKAKFSYADKPLSLVALQRYEDARDFILFHLNPHRAQMVFIPGDVRVRELRIVTTPVLQTDEESLQAPTLELQSISLDGAELLQDVAAQAEDPWGGLLSRSHIKLESLRSAISEELAIPRWALENHFDPAVHPDAQFAIPDGRELHPGLARVAAEGQA